MIKINKLLLIFFMIIMLDRDAVLKAMPLDQDSRQSKLPVIAVLSPELSLQKLTIQTSFTRLLSQMKKTTLYTPRDFGEAKRSLTDRFGKKTIENGFDIATGNGDLLRLFPLQPWAADNIRVAGLELAEPDVYHKQPASFVDQEKHWQGLDIVFSFADLKLHNPGVTLINETLIDKKGFADLNQRLEQYDQILRPGDWLTLANIQHDAYIEDKHFTRWLDSKQYKYEVLFPLRDYIPDDYPKSYWWNYFANGFLNAKHYAPPYLIVAQKISLTSKSLASNFNSVFEQSI